MKALHRLLPALAALGWLLAASSAVAAPSSFRTGFTDPSAFQTDDASRQAAIEHLKTARGSVVRYAIEWRSIAPAGPPSSQDARNPAYAGYDWSAADSAIRQLRGAGVEVLFTTFGAPSWAEGPNRPPPSDDAPSGSWMPSPAMFGDFAEAAARRYNGRYPDPQRLGSFLPRVRYWQGWNEPNLTNFLTPQWTPSGSGFRPASPAHYRLMLNSFYAAIKKGATSNTVVTAGTAPYGDPAPGGRRIQPAAFVRELLCVEGRKKLRAARRCPGGPVRFDALAHHPYPIGPPRRTALNPDDVVVPDFDKLSGPLKVAIRAGRVRPKRSKQLWATEVSWDSSPPDPGGIPDRLRATYMAGAFNILWRDGVSVLTWYLMRDEPEGQGYEFGLQSGVYERGQTVAEDRAKYSLQAFRFPFTGYPRGRRTELWGVAPERGRTVLIQTLSGKRWRTIARLRPNRARMFLGLRQRIRKGTRLRAVQGSEQSLVWPVL